MKHLFKIAFLICIFPILSVQAANKEFATDEYLKAVEILDLRNGGRNAIECSRWAVWTYKDTEYILNQVQEKIAFTPFGTLPNITSSLKELDIVLKRYNKDLSTFLSELNGCQYTGIDTWMSMSHQSRDNFLRLFHFTP